MEANLEHQTHQEKDGVVAEEEEEEEVEEYVLLDLNSVSGHVEIPPNAPYVLSGLDTLEPVLTIDNRFKLIGHYEETVGMCFVFSEEEVSPVVQEETGPSETNLFAGKCIEDPNQASTKQLKTVACTQKILKFRLLLDDDDQDAKMEANN